MPSRERRSRKRDGVRGGGALAARGRGGGARRGAVRCSRLLPGREAGQAADRRGSQPDGEVALADTAKCPGADRRADGREDD